MGNLPQSLINAFYTADPALGLLFFVGDVVLINSGDRKGEKGWIISIEAVQPEQLYLVEYEKGDDAVFSVSQFTLLERNQPETT